MNKTKALGFGISLLFLGSPLTASAALLDNIQAYWDFNENTGTSLSDSAASNTGTFNGTTGSQWQSGILKSGLQFNGSDNNVTTSLNPLTGATSFTVQAWIYKTDTEFGDIVSNLSYPDNGEVSGFDLEYTKDDHGVALNPHSIIFGTGQISGVTGSFWSTPTDSIQQDTWYHIVAVWNDGSTPIVYINGVSQPLTPWNGTVTTTVNWGSSTPLGIGANSLSYSRHWFAGKIDEVGLWNRALSSAEVASLYNSGSGLRYKSFKHY